MKLVFERSKPGRKNDFIPALDVEAATIPDKFNRQQALRLPEISQVDMSRHYTDLADNSFGVNNGFYPLGSCTMKYNPKINDEMSALPNFGQIHPFQPIDTVQGSLEVYYTAEKLLGEITGMDAMTFQPAAGAQGELTGVMLIKAYHENNKDFKRNKIIVPDSAHGTNPATASMVNYETINIPSKEDGRVDLDRLKEVVGDDTAGLMLTNPSTVGLFEHDIIEITEIIHQAGGLCYYDGANLNAIMGTVRPGDMGFDVVHLNIHKTFSTPHGGGGPGAGPIGCKEFLKPYLPNYHVVKVGDKYEFETPEKSIGQVKTFYGHFAVVVRALTYILTLGKEGIPQASRTAVLNANYMRHELKDTYEMAYEGPCMHEFVMTLERLKKETGITALDVSKALLDSGMHPPTMYFPDVVKEALMIEPTETESKETLDKVIEVFKQIKEQAYQDAEVIKEAPINTLIGRVDETAAARNPILRYEFQ
ncbi:aminomethyl-transferring glycine dehydrogenase subunit GcvPB [Vagococcus carniphilus]|uniref:aminomethyl-transferring glycine dehydrogenase subunit GcvPB n=2 Tax=Vagococcus carniphilus TaxID=218144 RepID=UPI00288E853B|nr:aminomethyl-transferring glycine dehydrogenase subunit GcvPB [Vagococcus carniphilus]MDT2815506.1 aminomethyl-transferring glycine dehydrogenase subunit GcvPB [Vagococcus carniphilus]MDT2864614.1 aminomethyl-transferring glycine dehydrogenase subunit GcvPB [Vagococcus carniphilus]